MRTFLFTLAASVLLAGNALAQDTAVIQGRITDTRSGRPIAGATVRAVSPSGVFESKTDRDGYYAFRSLPDASTDLYATVAGYSEFAVVHICAQSDQTRHVSIALPRGMVTIIDAFEVYPQWRCRFGGD